MAKSIRRPGCGVSVMFSLVIDHFLGKQRGIAGTLVYREALARHFELKNKDALK